MFSLTDSALAIVSNTPFYIPKALIESENQDNQAQFFDVQENSLIDINERGFGFENLEGFEGLSGSAGFRGEAVFDKKSPKFFVQKRKGTIQGFRSNVSFVFHIPLGLATLSDPSQYDFFYSNNVALLVCYRVFLALSKISNLEKYPITSRYFTYIGYNIWVPVGVIESVVVGYNKDQDIAIISVNGYELEWEKERTSSFLTGTSSRRDAGGAVNRGGVA